MERYCQPLSRAPGWKRSPKGYWTCLSCNRSGLLVRHRHKSWPPPVRIPVYGRTGRSRREVVAYTLVSPVDGFLKRYKWRITDGGYVCRQSTGYRPDGTQVGISIFIHRQILGLKRGDTFEGHHINDDSLDNQRPNLLIATRSENEIYKHVKNVRLGTLPGTRNR